MSYYAAAVAHPNIAFIKYWGNTNDHLRIPANGSLSMNLADLQTKTKVEFSSQLVRDRLILNGNPLSGKAFTRVVDFLDLVRGLSGKTERAEVISENNFPAGAGIASSASGFAALSLAASQAAGLDLNKEELSRLARKGSGSACRSVPEGFVEWQAGESDQDSFAFSIALPDHWDLRDCIAIVSEEHKAVGSTKGHHSARSSPLQSARVKDAPRRLDVCREAIRERDFSTFARVVEQDNHLMHAVMMSSQPPLFYWLPASVQVMLSVRGWRDQSIPVCYTLDAGPNVHVLCPASFAEEITTRLGNLPGVKKVLESSPGAGAYLLPREQDAV